MIDEAIQREYDNRAKVPDAPAIFEGWARDAAAFRAARPQADLGVSYGPSDRQAMDVFWPSGARDTPLAMFLHGGYWQSRGREWFSHLAAGLLANGVAVAMPSYDLCPAVTLAALTEEVREAAVFLFRRHRRRMAAAGPSAGGHLAAMLMATDWRGRDLALPAGMVAAALPISGLFDLQPLVATTINGALRLNAAEARRLSPLFLPSPGLPHYAGVGETEGVEYGRQSRRIVQAWGGSWEAVPQANHFTVVAALTDAASPMVQWLAAAAHRAR